MSRGPSKGYLQIPNSLAEAFAKYDLTGGEWRVLWVIIRKTWGWAKTDHNGQYLRDENGAIVKKKMDVISISQLAEATGMGKGKAWKNVTSLVKRKVVKRGFYRGRTRTIGYSLQDDPGMWAPVKRAQQTTKTEKDRVIQSPDDNSVSLKGNAVSPEGGTVLYPWRGNTKEGKKSLANKRRVYYDTHTNKIVICDEKLLKELQNLFPETKDFIEEELDTLAARLSPNPPQKESKLVAVISSYLGKRSEELTHHRMEKGGT